MLGTHQEEIELDVTLLKKHVTQLSASIGLTSSNISDEYIHEMYSLIANLQVNNRIISVRYGACELHNIAAFMGGVASQEVIKIITKQYVPVFHTLVFNGIQGSCSVISD